MLVARKCLLSFEVLQRKTKRVKFDRHLIISSKTSNGNKIFNYLGAVKDIWEDVGSVG